MELIFKEHASPEEEEILFKGINNEAFLAKGIGPIQSFAFFIKEGEEIQGGIKGVTYYGSLYVDMLWVAKEVRDQGVGTKLMDAAEDLARKRNCRFSSLTTMDWEALPFYQKRGYEIEYVREGYDRDSKMYVLRKQL